MEPFDLLAAAIVVAPLLYVTFLTLAEWVKALRKDEGVPLLPEPQGRRRPWWIQMIVILVGLAICVPLFYFGWIPLASLPPGAKRALEISGLVLYLLGIALTLWARRALGENWGISTSVQVKLRAEHQLVQAGPYARIRHPMYLGWWISMLGLTLLYPVWVVLALFAFSLISFSLRARKEEAALAERFGEAWAAYEKRTWRLIPFLY